MRICLSYLLLFCSVIVFGQNYQIITPGTDRFFITETNHVVGIRIKQTIPILNGNEYYNYSFIQESYDNENFENCAYKITPSWLGKKVIAQNDGLHVLFNKKSDSIYINASIIKNKSWTLYTDSSGNYIEATVLNIIEDSLLNDIDQ